jgi:hypothetical protein
MGANMGQKASAFAGVRKRAVRGGPPTVGIAAPAPPPRDTELLTGIVGGRRVCTQKVAHLRAQRQDIEFSISGGVQHVGAFA